MKIKKGDTILVVSGKDKGKKGKVARVYPAINNILIDGINLVKKHVRPKKQGEKGQVVAIAKSFDASRVKLVCPKCGQAVRIGFKMTESGKFRICKKCKEEI